MNIVILGYIVRAPLGGLAWHHFQYVLGIKALKHEVLFLEDSDNFPGCYNPKTSTISDNPDYGLVFINELFKAFNLKDNWSYFDAHTNSWYGLNEKAAKSFCSKADLVLNISGVNPVRDWWSSIPRRILIDTDPGFTQIKHLSEPSAFDLASLHTHYFSFAENIGKANCTIPDDGLEWKSTRQPIYMNAWKATSPTATASWTTVMQWDSYKVREYKSKIYGMKSESFQKFDQLPRLFPNESFELALGNVTGPIRDDLTLKGWSVISSLIPTETPWSYQRYIAQSKGEWSVAKGGYVKSNSGWFSERSACYLASGKPVIIQDTGFSQCIPVGKGLFSFNDIEDLVEVLNLINKEYSFQCKKAKELAYDEFDSKIVLGKLLINI